MHHAWPRDQEATTQEVTLAAQDELRVAPARGTKRLRTPRSTRQRSSPAGRWRHHRRTTPGTKAESVRPLTRRGRYAPGRAVHNRAFRSTVTTGRASHGKSKQQCVAQVATRTRQEVDHGFSNTPQPGVAQSPQKLAGRRWARAVPPFPAEVERIVFYYHEWRRREFTGRRLMYEPAPFTRVDGLRLGKGLPARDTHRWLRFGKGLPAPPDSPPVWPMPPVPM